MLAGWLPFRQVPHVQQTFDSTALRLRPAAAAWRDMALDGACALCAAAPLVLTAHIPLYDLPNHMGMLHVLLDRAASLTLQQIYGAHWAFVPNMGLQVFAWLLSPLLPVEASVRLFCIATVLLLCAGTRALSLALSGGAPGLRLYRAAPLLCWGGPMQFGFISYCFGIALMLLALALYVRMRERRAVVLFAVFAQICFVLLGTHLMAFGLFLAAIAGLELSEAIPRLAHAPGALRASILWLAGRAALAVSLALPALAVLLLAPPLRNTAAPNFKAATAEGFSLFYKAESLAAITWFAMPDIEVPLLVAAAFCAGLALVLGWIRPHWRMAGMVGVLGVVWLILPRGITASFYVDYRVPWAICFIFLAGLMPGAPAARQNNATPRHAMAGLLAAMVAVRLGSVSLRWLHCEPELAAIDHALATLPEGTSLWLVKGMLPGKVMKTPPLEHAAGYLVLRRDGFESEVFAGAAGQMVSLQPHYLPLYRMEAAHDLLALPPGYDAVLVLYPALVRRAPGLDLRQVAVGAHFELLRRR